MTNKVSSYYQRTIVMNIEGHYNLTLKTPVGSQQGSLTLKVDGSKLSGELSNARGHVAFDGGTVKGDQIAFDTKIPTPLGRMKAHVTGQVQGDHLVGDARLPLGTAHIDGQRVV
jgi:carbon-monoxide dehydrogenase large subunit